MTLLLPLLIFFGIAVVHLQKTWPKKKNPTARKVLAVGF